jgi:hypothetical protein
MHKVSWLSQIAAALLLMTHFSPAETVIKRIPTQFIAALGEPTAKSGDWC